MSQQSKNYKLLAFDLDGTLFDTADLNFKAYQLAYYDLGVEITPEMFAKTHGLSVYEFNSAMGVKADVAKLRELKADYYREYVTKAKPNEYLLNLIKNTSCKIALVTSARKINVQPLLAKYELKFDYEIYQEDVTEHKPDPSCYNLLTERSGISPEDSLAFEDSRAGFVAARSANYNCVMVKDFSPNCIRDMSGGSDSKTLLLMEDNRLIVRKEAYTAKAAERLYNQYEWMVNNIRPNFIAPIRSEVVGEGFNYDMDYLFAPSLYDYLNKIRVMPAVAKTLNQLVEDSHVQTNEQDIRSEMFKRYIEPGYEIALHVAASSNSKIPTPPISLKEIPASVNNFRLTNYHGDSTFENILVQRDGSIMFIDPVPDNNVINGIAHDFSKLGQSLSGYEPIRDGRQYNYDVELELFDELAKKYLTEDEYCSLKFYTATLYLRRLKHQIEQNPDLVMPYYKIAARLLDEFKKGIYSWKRTV